MLKNLNKIEYAKYIKYKWITGILIFSVFVLTIICCILIDIHIYCIDYIYYIYITICLGLFLEIYLIILWFCYLKKKFNKKIKLIYIFQKRKIERFYSFSYSGSFSGIYFTLTPKINTGPLINSNNNFVNINQPTNNENRNERILNLNRIENNEFNNSNINNSNGKIPIYNIEKVEEYPDEDSKLNEKLLKEN